MSSLDQDVPTSLSLTDNRRNYDKTIGNDLTINRLRNEVEELKSQIDKMKKGESSNCQDATTPSQPPATHNALVGFLGLGKY